MKQTLKEIAEKIIKEIDLCIDEADANKKRLSIWDEVRPTIIRWKRLLRRGLKTPENKSPLGLLTEELKKSEKPKEPKNLSKEKSEEPEKMSQSKLKMFVLLFEEKKKLLQEDIKKMLNHQENIIPRLPFEDHAYLVEVDNGLIDQETTLIEEIDHALERIKKGNFGVCIRCKRRIPEARLQALPATVLCKACKLVEEDSLE